MEAKIKKIVTGYPTSDGAGVKLVRVLGQQAAEDFDPILMLDSFQSSDPADYVAGFPLHPHRGIETISYVHAGTMVHKASLANEDAITSGEVQWMSAGSGILHEEKLPPVKLLLGVQLWLNLPAGQKMSDPDYHAIKKDQIKKIPLVSGELHLLAGRYLEHQGYQAQHLSLDYYDIHLDPGASITIPFARDRSVMLFTLVNTIVVDQQIVEAESAIKLNGGDQVTIKAGAQKAQVLFISSKALKEPVAWGGSIVMNNKEQLHQAFVDLEQGTFVKKISHTKRSRVPYSFSNRNKNAP